VDLLGKYGIGYSAILGDRSSRITDVEVLRKSILELFGGMGSISDIVISKDNGHNVVYEKETNAELGALLDVLYEEAKYSSHGIDAGRPIPYFVTYPREKAEWEVQLLNPDINVVIHVLIWITFYHPDWDWVEDWCLRFSHDKNSYVRGVAVTCLADIAILHEALHGGSVVTRLGELADEIEIRDRVESAMADIKSVLNVTS
jgi:hypothetical protein